jgi:hypothetical protein
VFFSEQEVNETKSSAKAKDGIESAVTKKQKIGKKEEKSVVIDKKPTKKRKNREDDAP